jgi:hypothetical protein
MHRIIVILMPKENESLKYFLKPARIVANLRDLRNRITASVALVNRDMLTRVWDEMDYRIYVCRISKGGHICELCEKYLVNLSLFQCNKIWYLLRSLFIIYFQNVSRTYE